MPQPLEDLPKTGEVFLPRGEEDDNVIEIEEARFPVETRKDAIHEAVEGGGALQRPNGTWLNSYSCPLLVRNAVFSLSRSMIGTCQYPLFRSRVENQRAPCNASRRSSIQGRG